jgi:ABC-type multidrug transport system fused ATPase/permease subunit
MDEATSMIDADSEAHITDAINEFSRGRTTLVVAHRLSTVVNSDRIAVLDAGRLIDQGTHAELLERCDVYRTLARTQLVGSG